MAEWSIAVVQRAQAMDHKIDEDLGPPALNKTKGVKF
jgi:hypothetical protein